MRCPATIALATLLSLLVVGTLRLRGIDRPKTAPDEVISKITANLPVGTVLRNELQLGRRGDGIRQPWMDDMSRHGVKQVSAGVRIAWWKETERPRLTELTYFTEYERPDSHISPGAGSPAGWLQLGHQLSEVIEHLAIANSAAPTVGDPCRELGISIFDNEWLPQIIVASDLRAAVLTDLVREGSLQDVQAALDAGADVNQSDDCGRTGLFDAAAARPDVRLLKALLNRGADPNSKDQDGWTALHNAAWYDRAAAVTLLLEHGAAANATDNDGQTPLIVAAARGNVNAVRAILANHPDTAATDKSGQSALSIAKANGQVAIVDLLRASGADR